MLLTREEQTYDFGQARFDLDRDRDVLGWIFSQFLFGEVTGVQVGEARRYGRALVPFRRKPDPLTETYLRDPGLRSRLVRP